VAQRYLERLDRLTWAVFPARVAGSVWWVFPLVCRNEAVRDAARAALAAAGVETRSYFWPLHRQPHLCRFATREYQVADGLARRGLYLPLWPDMSDRDVDYVCDAIAAI
jgi:perosamine synthetase